MDFYATVTPNELPRTLHHCIPGGTRLLLPASAYRRDPSRFRIPILPAHITTLAADCGGFVATFKWGDYRYTPDEYVEWLNRWPRPPQWAATMDYCCVDERTDGYPGIVRERQNRTTDLAHHFWQNYRELPWMWTPTIQGWDTADYAQHAADMAPLINEMATHYGDGFRVGVGTLCHRASPRQIRHVVNAVADVLPGVRFHLWGVKLGAIQSGLPGNIASVDSAAWHGLFKRTMHDWKPTGMKKIEYSWRVGYANYYRKVKQACSSTHSYQVPMF